MSHDSHDDAAATPARPDLHGAARTLYAGTTAPTVPPASPAAPASSGNADAARLATLYPTMQPGYEQPLDGMPPARPTDAYRDLRAPDGFDFTDELPGWLETFHANGIGPKAAQSLLDAYAARQRKGGR